MDARATVLAWHAALNAGDVARLLSLSTEDVEVGGPRGSGRGAALLRDWVARAGIQLLPQNVIGTDETLVVEQSACWLDSSGTLTEPQMVASVFHVVGGQVASVLRYGDTADALSAAGLAADA
ncbi:MAG TPA: nuclear transport factor 2 family protein [Chloroflexota bacterium]|nr:nuclear transport factor 2 family protein [Chloroflexota bacterium]